jgi:hypothetical protein
MVKNSELFVKCVYMIYKKKLSSAQLAADVYVHLDYPIEVMFRCLSSITI